MKYLKGNNTKDQEALFQSYKNLIPPDFVVGGIHAEKQWGWFP
jgi:hypothetical protein